MIDRRRLSIIRDADVWIDADGQCWRGDASRPLPQLNREEVEQWLGETRALRGRHVVGYAKGIFRVVYGGAGREPKVLSDGWMTDGMWTVIDANKRLPRRVGLSISGVSRELGSTYSPWLVHGKTAWNSLIDIEQ